MSGFTRKDRPDGSYVLVSVGGCKWFWAQAFAEHFPSGRRWLSAVRVGFYWPGRFDRMFGFHFWHSVPDVDAYGLHNHPNHGLLKAVMLCGSAEESFRSPLPIDADTWGVLTMPVERWKVRSY